MEHWSTGHDEDCAGFLIFFNTPSLQYSNTPVDILR